MSVNIVRIDDNKFKLVVDDQEMILTYEEACELFGKIDDALMVEEGND